MATIITESIIENRKFYKRNKILDIIRNEAYCSRADIKKITSYSMSTVLEFVDGLLKEGCITEEASTLTKVGRKPTWLKINPNYGRFVGFDIHGTRMNCALTDFDGKIIKYLHKDFRYDAGSDEMVDQIDSLINEITYSDDSIRGVIAIGFGFPGYFDAKNGTGINYPILKNWQNIPIKEHLENKYSCNCYVENNVSLMSLGYKYLDANTNISDDYLFVSVRSGVRLVPIINGETLWGEKSFAGQIGHIKIPNSSRSCNCGKKGCLNSEVGEFGLRAKIIERILTGKMQKLYEKVGFSVDNVDIEGFISQVIDGDEECRELLRETAKILGEALGKMLDIFSPKQLIVYGEIMKAESLFINPFSEALKSNSMPENSKNLSIKLCPPDERLGAYGATLLALKSEYEIIEETI